MKLFGFAGHSGSGKTTLLIKVIPLLTARGLKVSTIKQANPGFDIDTPGKDSHEHRVAGAREVLVASAKRWALMHEYREQPEFTMEQLLERMSPVDLVLVEGFRRWSHPRIEVWRPEMGKSPMFADDPLTLAVASTGPVPGLDRPWLSLDDTQAIADFVLAEVSR
jgi:molybdopterin-guanine dinucleotide biosynthesis protein B